MVYLKNHQTPVTEEQKKQKKQETNLELLKEARIFDKVKPNGTPLSKFVVTVEPKLLRLGETSLNLIKSKMGIKVLALSNYGI